MAQRTDILRPLNTNGVNQFDPAAMLSSISSGLVYDVTGYSSITPQVSAPLDAAAAGVITVQCSQDLETWSNMPGGQVQFTSVGVKPNITVEGLRYIRFQVTTTSGVVEYKLTVIGSGGDLVVFPTPLGVRGYYGVFSANADQSIGLATATPVLLDTTEESNGVSLGSPLSRVVVANAGTYNFQFSAQLRHTSGGSENVSVWFRLNGTNIARSNTDYAIAGNNAAEVMAWNYVATLAAGDYFEIVMSATDSDIILDYMAAATSPTRPATPAVILTVTQVMQTQAGPAGATGPAGSTSFVGLTDTPASYSGAAYNYTRVNAGATALEFASPVGNLLYGDGSDGVGSISTATLTENKNYTDLTVTGTLTTGGFRICCTGTLTITGTGSIQRNASNGSAGTGSSGGAGGSATTSGLMFFSLAGSAGGNSTATTGVQGSAPATSAHFVDNSAVNSGSGGSGSGGAGGVVRAGGTVTTTRLNVRNLMMLQSLTTVNYASGSGGGGGGGGGNGTSVGGGGGGGGAGGGSIMICAKNVVIQSGGSIQCKGGDGGAGVTATNSNTGGGGGGAGGAGGIIILIYDTYSNSGTVTVAGGAGGGFGAGNGTGTAGTAGGTGATGLVLRYNALRGVWE